MQRDYGAGTIEIRDWQGLLHTKVRIKPEHFGKDNFHIKLKSDFIFHQFGDEYLLVYVGKATNGFHGVVKMNGTSAFIVECLHTETSEEEIVDKILDIYNIDRETAAENARYVINQLQGINAVE